MQDFTLDKGKIAIAIAGLFCLFAVYGAITDFKLPSKAQAVEPAQAIIELDPVNIQLLTKTHLFGQPPQVVAKINAQENKQKSNTAKVEQREQPEPVLVNTTPININVSVTGLLASTNMDYSAAVLSVDNKPEKLYRVGDDLGKPEIKLQSVKRDSVVIDNNGNEQIYSIKRPGLESSSSGGNGRVNNNTQVDQSYNELPDLPPELEIPEDLQGLNNAGSEGAYTSAPMDPIDVEQQLPEDLENELLQAQLDGELDEQTRAQLDELSDDHGVVEEDFEEYEEIDADTAPDFQMPVF